MIRKMTMVQKLTDIKSMKLLKKTTKIQENEEFTRVTIKIFESLNLKITEKEKKRFQKLFHLMTSRTHLTPLMVLVGLKLLSDFMSKETDTHFSFEEVELFFISSCILAQKFYEDVFWNNKLYIEYLNLNISIQDLSKIEFYILEKIDWKINYSCEELEQFICKFQ